jgi:hypothetical protein
VTDPTYSASVYRWTAHFDGHPDEALTFRDWVIANGTPADSEGRAKQLGMAWSLTPFERRCAHFGDVETCPACVQDRSARQAEDQAAKDRERRLQRDLEASRTTIRRQSDALSAADARIKGLRRLVDEMQRAQARRRRLPFGGTGARG